MFESIAKTNTTNTINICTLDRTSLRVLLKQIQQTHASPFLYDGICLRVLLKQIQQTLYNLNRGKDSV